jgi:hypothetical protein
MPSFLAPIVAFYDYALQPLPAFAWLGVPVSALDVIGALRLAVSLRQVRQLYHDQHVARISATNGRTEDVERRSRVRDFVATLVMVHGGEAIAGASQGGGRTSNLVFIVFCCSTMARPATFVPRLWNYSHDILERACAGRLVAHSPETVHKHRASPNHSPCVPSHDIVMQCDPQGSCGTRFACRSDVAIQPTADGLCTCQDAPLTNPVAHRTPRSCRMADPSLPICSRFYAPRRCK